MGLEQQIRAQPQERQKQQEMLDTKLSWTLAYVNSQDITNIVCHLVRHVSHTV